MLFKYGSSKTLQYEINILIIHRELGSLTALLKITYSALHLFLCCWHHGWPEKYPLVMCWKGKTNIHGKSSASLFSVHGPLGTPSKCCTLNCLTSFEIDSAHLLLQLWNVWLNMCGYERHITMQTISPEQLTNGVWSLYIR